MLCLFGFVIRGSLICSLILFLSFFFLCLTPIPCLSPFGLTYNPPILQYPTGLLSQTAGKLNNTHIHKHTALQPAPLSYHCRPKSYNAALDSCPCKQAPVCPSFCPSFASIHVTVITLFTLLCRSPSLLLLHPYVLPLLSPFMLFCSLSWAEQLVNVPSTPGVILALPIDRVVVHVCVCLCGFGTATEWGCWANGGPSRVFLALAAFWTALTSSLCTSTQP